MNISKSRTLIMGVVMVQLLSFSTPTFSYYENDYEVSFADVAIPMTIAGAALGLFGAACLYDELPAEKYQVGIDYTTKTEYDHCCTRYNHILQIMQDAYLLPSSPQELYQEPFRAGVPESVLYQLASTKKKKIDTYVYQIHNDISQLHYHHNQVLYRIDVLRDKKTYRYHHFSLFDAEELRTLEYLSRDVTHLSNQLETVASCLEYHRAYFVLYDVENVMWKRYPDELASLYNKNYTYDVLVQYVRDIMWRKHLTSYAYNAYCSQLKQDISLLHNTLHMTPYYYPDRVGAAQELHNHLDFLYGILLAHQ